MNKDYMENEIFSPLTPEEERAIDRILSSAADAEDREVDYSAIYRRVRARASKQGLSVFSPARKKKRSLRRVFTGVAAAAAMLVVGLGAYGVLKSGLLPAVFEKSADKGEHTAVANTEMRGGSSSASASTAPAATVCATQSSPFTLVTEPPATEIPAATLEPVTPEPTEYVDPTLAFGYVELGAFDSDPEAAGELVPDLLPDPGEVKELPSVSDQPLEAHVMGILNGEEYNYTCAVMPEVDEELEVGFARYEQTPDGELTYIWRVTEDTCLRVSLTSFDREGAERLLSKLALDNRVAAMRRALPTPDPKTEESRGN